MSVAAYLVILGMVLIGCIAVALCMAAATLDDWQGDLGSDDLTQMADDMHLAKVARMADSMKADREEAFAKYLQSPANGLPAIRRGDA
jgi:hypothetical protein